ncbi:hypothetical protein E1B28_007624 [Marasmius oreades]|uniref:Sulfhydryl oxidase n=1 Tax=Marasmius oreades TaxID=181124 RepID=A0A9P7UVW5_9AGAR|nr:uncharacterized protein E1B28_007624 [Marasmius oreades]KAG7093994.1 hypothetical protein E1B28_007624 [Marasmius oreades]
MAEANTDSEEPVVKQTDSTAKVAQLGVVLGPDGKPCKPCTAFRNWRRLQKSEGEEKGKSSTLMAFGPSSSSNEPDRPPAHCPPDVEQLGNATWTFLHSTAAYYPNRPTPNHRANMLLLIRAIPTLYPCSHCADDFGQDVKVNPPDVSSRAGLSKWLCERHNEVNLKLGKKPFDCTLEKLDERWKNGPRDGSCD